MNLTPVQAKLVLEEMLASGRLRENLVVKALRDVREHLNEQLAQLRGVNGLGVRERKVVTIRKRHAVKRPATNRQRQQGHYIAALRGLNLSQRRIVRGVLKKSGVTAAIASARELAKPKTS